jgi:tRNA modification GTPase
VTEETPPATLVKELGPLSEGQKLITALNKTDLLDHPVPVTTAKGEEDSCRTLLSVSALTGEGIQVLHKTLVRLASSGFRSDEHDVLITNRRHKEALERAAADLDRARATLTQGATNEFVALDLREAVNSLSEITGQMTSEEILNAIFSRFCIGK